ncbi:TIR-like protein FxsC [Streptomyces griseoincarnatus]|uniref:TIR-like protein FxsC n=1 Tax=Streptomyces sp. SMS_SU21 TaxID=2069440 RepID=UPI0027DFD257|nr:TIR-like protein FxsC [Streptomyces sp. SMS_SU21]
MPEHGAAPDPLGHVVHALEAVVPALDGTALAEVLWLAARMAEAPAGPPAGVPPAEPAGGPPVPPSSTPADEGGLGPAAREEGWPLHERLAGASAHFTGSAVAASRGVGLPLAQEVTRALRPWKRPWPRGRRTALDVDATVDGYARSGELIPVFRPAPERWFGLVLVVDRSPAMRVWRETVDDFRAVLDRLGAFRSLQVRELGFGGEGPELRDGLGRLTGPDELRSADARRLVVVVSDCAAPGWRDPEVWRRIRSWAMTTPVALLNPLPPKLWRRTALDLPSVRVRPAASGVDHQQLVFDPPPLLEGEPSGDTGPWLPVPVLSTSPYALERWSRTLMRGDPDGCGAVLVPRGGRLGARSHGRSGGVTAEGFLRTASPAAVQLALLCAPFGRLGVGLLHLIRQELVPLATVGDVAELLTSGLFGIDASSGESVELVVPDAVRDRLARELTMHEVRRLDRAIERAEQRGGLPAVAYDPRVDTQHRSAARAFAHARRRTRELLGLPTGDRPPTGRERVVGTWHRERPGADNRPFFFLSYAHTPRWGPDSGDPDHWVHMFFRDLCDHIYQLTDLPAGTPAGFIDRELRSDEGWEAKLSENLANCRVLVPLFSPRYFASETCGKEWYAFNERVLHARATGDASTTAIVPALWTRVDANVLPDSVRHLHLLQESFGDRYTAGGIYGLIKLRRLRDEYEEVVFRLAQRIVQVAHESPLPPGRPRDYHATPSAFRPWGAGPRHIRLLVAAPTQDGIPDDRDVRPYGETPQDWNPYYSETSRPLANLAEHLVRSLDYRVTVSSFDDEPIEGDGRFGDAEERASRPDILLVDRWALADEERRRRLRAFDRNSRPWVSMIVPTSGADLQNHGEKGQELTEALGQTLSRIADRGRRTDARLSVIDVPTVAAFTSVLPAVVSHVTRQFLKHAEAHPPPGEAVPLPRLLGSAEPFPDRGSGPQGAS